MALPLWVTLLVTRGCSKGPDKNLVPRPQSSRLVGTWPGPCQGQGGQTRCRGMGELTGRARS